MKLFGTMGFFVRPAAMVAVITGGFGTVCPEAVGAAPQIYDIQAAREYCDSRPLDRIEGIWNLTDADTQVLIALEERHPGRYVVILLRNDDCRMMPGDTLAILARTADPLKYRMDLRNAPPGQSESVAILGADDSIIEIQKPIVKVEITPERLLRRFRSLFHVRRSYPADRLNDGMVRLYPPDPSQLPSQFRKIVL